MSLVVNLIGFSCFSYVDFTINLSFGTTTAKKNLRQTAQLLFVFQRANIFLYKQVKANIVINKKQQTKKTQDDRLKKLQTLLRLTLR